MMMVSNLLFIKACANIGHYDKGQNLINSMIKDVTFNNINCYNLEFITTFTVNVVILIEH